MATSVPTAHRRRLLDAFAEVLREKGLARTGIADVVRCARVSKRTFYECFPDKESAFVELIREASVRTFLAVEAVADAGLPWPERVDRAVDAYLGALAIDPVLHAAVSHDLPALGAQGAALRREALDRFAGLFVRISHDPRLRDAGVTPIDHDTALLIVGGIAELLDRATLAGRPLQEIGPTIKAVIRAVGATTIAPGRRRP